MNFILINYIGTNKKVLDGVTGTIRSGRVTAVMGPSGTSSAHTSYTISLLSSPLLSLTQYIGAGKTTFLTTLAGKASYGKRTGTVLINGVPADIQQYKKVLLLKFMLIFGRCKINNKIGIGICSSRRYYAP